MNIAKKIPQQLIEATYDNQSIGLPHRDVTYQYDAVGNRVEVMENGNKASYSANKLNQYTAVAGSSLTYSPNGNLTSQNGWAYDYDAQNRLVNAYKGAMQVSFVYDGLNRCVKRTLNGTPTYLCYAGWNLIEEHNSNGALLAAYVHGAKIDEILRKTDANGTVYYHQDALGNVIYLTDTSGKIVEQYRYDAFGQPTILDLQGTVITASAYANRFLFTGREWLSQLGLYDYRNRVYSADLGRFLQTDPIRFAAGDVNLYRYVANNPVNWTDPLGLLQWGDDCWGNELDPDFENPFEDFSWDNVWDNWSMMNGENVGAAVETLFGLGASLSGNPVAQGAAAGIGAWAGGTLIGSVIGEGMRSQNPSPPSSAPIPPWAPGNSP